MTFDEIINSLEEQAIDKKDFADEALREAVQILRLTKQYMAQVQEIATPKKKDQQLDPLTLDELREMDGTPVWVVRDVVDIPIIRRWGVVNAPHKHVFGADFLVRFDDYGDWLAYRHRQMEGRNDN